MPLNQVWRERLHTTGWLIFGLLLVVALIRFLLQPPDAAPRAMERSMPIALIPPSTAAPLSRKVALQRPTRSQPAASSPIARSEHSMSMAAVATKTVTPAAALPSTLAMSASANPDPLTQDHAATGKGNKSNGLTIGGGGGSGCGNIVTRSYVGLINTQVMHVFKDSGKTGNQDFQIRARLWFDATGRVEQTELVESTGDAHLDAAISRQLGEVSLGQGIPPCMQPVQIRVSEPWVGSFARADDRQSGKNRATP